MIRVTDRIGYLQWAEGNLLFDASASKAREWENGEWTHDWYVQLAIRPAGPTLHEPVIWHCSRLLPWDDDARIAKWNELRQDPLPWFIEGML